MFEAVTLQQLPQNLYQLCQILQHASGILQQQYQLYQQGDLFDIQRKDDQSPVTQADLLVDAYLSQALAQIKPNLPILSEEGEEDQRHTWQQFWLVDPLDGTKEFINKTDEFTINLSLIDGGESVISALAVPIKQMIYIVQKGQLPFRLYWDVDGQQLSQYQHTQAAFSVGEQGVLNIAMSRRPQRSGKYADFLAFLDQKQLSYHRIATGSAYKFCMMLEGEIDIYPRFHPTCEWDTAAGQGLLQSIGGEVLTLNAKPFLYNQRETVLNGDFIALRQREDFALCQEFLTQL